jgi:hypothetical protein
MSAAARSPTTQAMQQNTVCPVIDRQQQRTRRRLDATPMHTHELVATAPSTLSELRPFVSSLTSAHARVIWPGPYSRSRGRALPDQRRALSTAPCHLKHAYTSLIQEALRQQWPDQRFARQLPLPFQLGAAQTHAPYHLPVWGIRALHPKPGWTSRAIKTSEPSG